MLRPIALLLICALYALGGSLDIILGHREQVRRYSRATKVTLLLVIAISGGVAVWGAATLVLEYGPRGPSVLMIAAMLFVAAIWVGSYYLTGSKGQQRPGGKAARLAFPLVVGVSALFLWFHIAVGAGDRVPRLSDLMFLAALPGLGGSLHYYLINRERVPHTPGFWKAAGIAAAVLLVAVAWTTWDYFMPTAT